MVDTHTHREDEQQEKKINNRKKWTRKKNFFFQKSTKKKSKEKSNDLCERCEYSNVNETMFFFWLLNPVIHPQHTR